jgi:oxygen-independent coproporphyrinogen-3 oxidase
VGGIRHLYVHLPFCVHRCGYCDFVTAVGRRDEHGPYVEALLRELELEAPLLDADLDTVFVGGGTPTFTEPAALARLLRALPPAREVTVEANPETLTPAVARVLRDGGVTRVSVGAQTFAPRLLEVLERTATPDDVRRAVHTLRDADFDNISLDLVYGIPGQEPADLDADLTEALALEPQHLSAYELEAKPGTRFTHAWGDELARQAEAMEGYFEGVVERVTGAGYRWYETSNFCLVGEGAGGRDLRAHHNLNTWRAGTYLGIGVGAVSTLPVSADAGSADGAVPGAHGAAAARVRRRNLPSVPRYVAALAAGEGPPREDEPIDARTAAEERLMLALRLDEPLALAGLDEVLDPRGLARMVEGGLVRRVLAADPGVDAGARGGVRALDDGGDAIVLTPRGRFLGGGVTAEILAG